MRQRLACDRIPIKGSCVEDLHGGCIERVGDFRQFCVAEAARIQEKEGSVVSVGTGAIELGLLVRADIARRVIEFLANGVVLVECPGSRCDKARLH